MDGARTMAGPLGHVVQRMTAKEYVLTTPPCRHPWSFPQLLSTYRFWSLLLMMMFVMLAVALVRNGHLQMLMYTLDARDNAELFYQMLLLIKLGGLALAAGMSRWISARGLAIGIFGCALACLLTLLTGEAWAAPLQWVSLVSSELLLSILSVAIPALIAARTRSIFAISSAFAVLSLMELVTQSALMSWRGEFMAGEEITVKTISAFCLLIAAACIVLPNRILLFRQAPHRSFSRRAPQQRNSLEVAGTGALLWVVYPLAILGITLTDARGDAPGVWIRMASVLALYSIWYSARWFHHIHAEAATLVPLRDLFTARAALWTCLLMPLSGPLLLLSLGRNLYREMHRQRLKPICTETWFSLLAVVMTPLAMGVAQSMMNALAAATPVERISTHPLVHGPDRGA